MTPVSLESAVAILDKHRYRGCRWFVITAGSEYQLRFAAGDFIETNARAERITFVEFEACAIAAALEPMTPKLLRDVEALCDAVIDNCEYRTDDFMIHCVFCKVEQTSFLSSPLPHDINNCAMVLATRICEQISEQDS